MDNQAYAGCTDVHAGKTSIHTVISLDSKKKESHSNSVIHEVVFTVFLALNLGFGVLRFIKNQLDQLCT